jgi:hypothetical protein
VLGFSSERLLAARLRFIETVYLTFETRKAKTPRNEYLSKALNDSDDREGIMPLISR